MRRPPTPAQRLGFTMIELLVVIVILGILIGLLLPAVMRAVTTARNAEVDFQINTMAQALADFKSKYGDYPPSQILLVENGDYSGTGLSNGATAGQLARSVAALRKFWPRLAVSTSGPVAGAFYDFSGRITVAANTPTTAANMKAFFLSGDECLVFFLGGIPQGNATSTWGMSGFGKNPANPFVSAALNSNRFPAYYEFKSTQLYDVEGDGFPSYKDGLADDGNSPGVFVYFSAYGGAGYDPSDYDLPTAFQTDEVDNNGVNLVGAFYAPNTISIATGNKTGVFVNSKQFVASIPPNPYTTNPPVQTTATGDAASANLTPRNSINPNTFQIISPGVDRAYGIGGQWLQNGTPALPFVNVATTADTVQTSIANQDVTGVTLENGARQVEKDNLTNFTSGTLD